MDHKTCKACGRDFSWRKKWKNNWEEVKFCSKSCSKINLKSIENLKFLILKTLASENNEIILDQLKLEQDKRLIHSALRLLEIEVKVQLFKNNKKITAQELNAKVRIKGVKA